MKKIFKLILLSLLISVAGKAQIKLVGNITTNGVASYPTHIDSLGKGGYMSMPTITDRDNIPTLRRKYGMLVYVQANDSLYKLSSINLDNSNWITMGFASVLKLSNDSLLVYTKIKADSTTLAGRISALGNTLSGEIANGISGSNAGLAAEITRATNAENALSARITTNTTNIASNTTSITNLASTISAATSSNTANTIALRDANGNFSAGIITASLAGNASTTTKLAAPINIYGNPFDGSTDLTQAIAGTFGGTGINNGNKTITLGGNILTANSFTTAGNYSTTLTSTGVTDITLPTTGTIATLAGTETLTNKTIVSPNLTGVPTAPTATSGTNTTQLATTAFVSAVDAALGSRIDVHTTNINSNTLSIGVNATNIAANTTAINNRVSFSDMPAFLLPYLKIEDTTNMLLVYRAAMIDNNAKIVSLIADTATLITRFGLKENLSNKSTDVSADGTSNTKYPTVKSVKDFVDATITAATPDATTTSKGKIQLAGDLAGIAASPTVSSVGGSTASAINTATLLANAATDANTASTIVKRDASGNFIAGNITASLTGNVTGNLAGNASTTTKLAAPKNIYGNPFDGLDNLTQAIAGTFGGTGVNNGIKTITLGGNILTANSFTTAGNFSTTLTSTGITDITLPTTGTIATLAGTETMTNKTIVDVNLTGVPTAPTAAAGTSNTQLATTAFVTSTTSAATPDASTTVKGKVQLAGDLGGIATSPTVNTVGGSSSTTINTATLLANAATDANTPNTIVKRDASGNFTAGVITATLAGNASTTTKLAAPKNIYGNPFDGLDNLTQAIAGTFGGTGVNNGIKTITLGGNILTANSFTTAGNFSTTLTSTGITDITLPTTGTIATLAGTETLTNKTIASVILTGVPTAPTAAAGTSNTQLATTAFVTATTSAATPDASTTVKGKVQLAGDLGGIATSPTVITVGGSTASNINAAELLANAATDANTPNTIVKRDASGNFTAGVITATLAGNASTTTKLAAPKNIYGNPFDGLDNLTQAIAGTFGGTGVNNGIKTITLGGNILTANSFTTAGNFSTILRSTAATDITLPTTGTIATLAGTESMTNKTIVDVNLTGVPIAPTAAAGTSTTQVATTAFVTATTSAATPDASTTVKGKVQLAGDLGGIATSPTVNTVGGSTAANIRAAELLANAATDANTPNTIVKRDASGNFIAGNITAGLIGNVTGNLNGNATTATTASNITATSNTTLTSLANLNTVGTITSGVWSGTIIDVAHGGTGLATTSQNYIFAGPIAGAGAPSFRALTSADVPAGSGNYIFNSTTQQTSSNFNISGTGVIGTSLTAGSLSLTTALSPSSGGTGINNGTKTITLGGNVLTGGDFTTIGSSSIILRTSGATDITLPTTGTLATTAQLQAIQGGTFSGGQITGIVFPENGGTGIANLNTKTITLGGPLVTTGTGTITLNSSASGSTITLPTSGTIATLAGTETLTNKTIVDVALTGVPTAPTATAGTSTTQIATTAFVTATTTAATPDASTTVKGKVQLAGDLGGTATSPTVNTVGGSSSATIRTAELLANAATNLNTASTIVKRDASGNFNAGTITGNLSGNATTATIAGNITATSNTTLTSLANLNTVGTITSGVWSASTIDVAHGGTGATTTSQSFVFAGPTSGAGAPTFRALTSADVPAGSGSYIANGTTQQASSNFNISGNGVIGTSLTAGSLTLNNALSVENGGTGIATAPTNGQIDIGTSGGAFARTNITAGTGVSIANGSGSITISATGSGGTVTNVSALTLGTTGTDVNSTVANSTTTPTITLNIPSASSTARGLITTGAQTIAGAKTFSGTTVFNSDITVNGLTVGAGPNNTITTNTVLGKNALASSSTSDYNTAIGYRALNSNGANAFGNTAVGANAINLNTSGERNTAVGESAMTKNTTGNSNTAVGEFASRDNSIGSDNTSIGNFALASNTGSKNTAIGSGANTTSTTIENTTAIGYGSTVSASNTIQLGNTDIANVKTSGTITAGNVTYPRAHNSIANQVLSIDASGNASFNSLGAAGATLTNGKILVGNASNVGTEVTVSGDITMTNAGVVSITAGAVSTADLANLAVTYAKMQEVSATNKVLGRTTTGAGPVEEISMSGSGNVSRVIVPTYASILSLNYSHSGSLVYTQHNNSPSFPDDLPDGFYCTIVNYGGAPCTSNTLTLAKFYTNNTGNTGSSTFTIPLGGTVSVYAITIGGAKRYYINYGDAPAIAGTGITNSAGIFNVNTSQNISTLSNLTTNGIVTTSGSTGALSVVASLPVTQGGTGLTTLGTNGQILTSNGTNMVWAPNSSASLAGGVAGAIPYQSGVGVTGYTTAGTAGQILTSAGTGTPTWISTVPVANGGTGASTLASNAVLLGNGTSAVQTVAPGASGNILTSNGTTWTSVAASSSGVTTLGNISATSNAKGATISGTTLTLTAADGTNGGVVTTAAQTFAGTKTFADVNLSGALNGASSATSTIAGFNAAISTVTAAITISSANAATYNGKVLVCSGSAFTVTFDNTVPVGFSCMILQSDNNTVSFSGTNNRYNYTSTSGIYAIATAMCYASGAVLLTGDLQ